MTVCRTIVCIPIVALAAGVTMLACSSTGHGSHATSGGLTFLEQPAPQTPIPDVGIIPHFAQALPLPSTTGGGISTVLGNRPLTLRMCEFWANVLPPGTFAPGVQTKTRVWGYVEGDTCPPNGDDDPARDTYIGPIVVNDRAIPEPMRHGDKWSKGKKSNGSTDVTWVNDLGSARTTKVLSYRFSTDQTLTWADPLNKEANDCSRLADLGEVPPFGSTCANNYMGTIPAVGHLHGGEVPAEIDGNPEAWFTSDGAFQGPAFYSFKKGRGHDEGRGNERGNSALYKYPNVQEAAPIWFHDHTLGATRLNVHSGLAGAYLIEDPSIIPTTNTTTSGTPGTCEHDCLPADFPPLAQVVPLVLQDRTFDTNGQFFFPADSRGNIDSRVNPQHPYWVPEFLGNTILVNGKVWPYLDVEAKRYQFMLLDGSNARAYELSIENVTHPDLPPPTMFVIGTDGGYLDAPTQVSTTATGSHLVMQPGERYLVIIDFTNIPLDDVLVLKNAAKAPLPDGDDPFQTPLADILQFRVKASSPATATSYDPANGAPIRTGGNAIVRLADPATGTLALGVQPSKTRQLTLNEVIQDGPIDVPVDPVTGQPATYEGGPLDVLVNNTHYVGSNRSDFTPVTIGPRDERITKLVSELPQEGDTEVWEIVNLTADAHPIHLHLVQFQLMNRQDIVDFDGYVATYNAAFPGGSFIAASGPPLSYGPSPASGGKLGGNPDVAPFLSDLSPAIPPQPYEAGWKDTVIMYPHQVTRIVVRFAPQDIATNAPVEALHYPFNPSNDRGYVWHCHIVDHEDNDMMRPYNVTLNPAAPPPKKRRLVKGLQY